MSRLRALLAAIQDRTVTVGVQIVLLQEGG
jgi:hypothetical protein